MAVSKEGRNKVKCAKYRANSVREKNKIKRILKSNGKKAAKFYAKHHNLLGYYNKLLRGVK